MLEEVCDPEIPVVNILEMGILRDVVLHENLVEVVITPTYTACPAMNMIEEELTKVLLDKEGFLYVGRQTANNEREIYFTCKDFRKPSKIFYETQQKYISRFKIEYDIYKDKYWQTFERFKQN